MVLLGWPFGERAHLPAFMQMTSFPGLGRLAARLPANDRTVRMIFKSLGHGASLKDGRIGPDEVAWFRALLSDTETMRNELAGRSVVGPFRGLSPRLVLAHDMLAKVESPALLLWGEGDPFGGPAVAEQFVTRLPDAELRLLEGCGHAPWLDEPNLCAEAIARFLAG
jgi:pimeloyl-ACP methyl ester carboxylesterase